MPGKSDQWSLRRKIPARGFVLSANSIVWIKTLSFPASARKRKKTEKRYWKGKFCWFCKNFFFKKDRKFYTKISRKRLFMQNVLKLGNKVKVNLRLTSEGIFQRRKPDLSNIDDPTTPSLRYGKNRKRGLCLAKWTFVVYNFVKINICLQYVAHQSSWE